MQDDVMYLTEATKAIEDATGLVPDIEKTFKLADEQNEVRAGIIRTINTMGDALQLACDLISKEISSSLVELNDLREAENVGEFQSFFRRTANRFNDASLGRLLHDGKVCGELHALGDDFRQPFSRVSRSALSFSQLLKAFFTRSSAMSNALHSLQSGERDYLRSLGQFLNDVVNRSELAGGLGDVAAAKQDGNELAALMRRKRQAMQRQVWELRDVADACIAKLH